METVLTILLQVVTMLLLAAVGFLMFRAGKISTEGSNVAVYAQLHNRDFAYAVETVVISALLSIITLPPVVGVAVSLF